MTKIVGSGDTAEEKGSPFIISFKETRRASLTDLEFPTSNNFSVYLEPKDKKKKKKEKKKKKDKKDGEDVDEEENDKDEEDEDEPQLAPISIKEMFRYAKSSELILIAIGISAAFIAGICLPAMIILFGRMTNAFVYQSLNLTALTIEYNAYNHTNITEDELAAMLGIGDFQKEIRIFGIGTSIVGAIEFVMGYIFVTSLNYAAEGQVFRLRGKFLKSILKQEIGWFDTHQTNNFASRVTEDLSKVQEGIGEKIGMFVFFMTTFTFSLVNAFVHGWQLTLVILSVFPLLAVSTGIIMKVQSSLTAIELLEYAKAGSIAEEALSSIRTVFAFGGEGKEVERYQKNLVQAKNTGVKRGLTTGVGMGMMWFIIYSSYALAFWYGSKLVMDSRPPGGTGQYTAADLIVVFFSVLMGAMNVGQSAPYMEAFNIARGAAATIYDIIERKSEIDPTEDNVGEKPEEVTGTVEFKNVYFNYPSRPYVKILQGISLKIHPGQTVALVGSSGCGKSTCIQLLQRFYDPAVGSISLDGKDIRSLNLGWLRDHIGIVGQEPVLFATTIAENIRYGKEGVSFDEIQKAAKEANAHNFIMKLPKQYDTHVGERGVQISGGQKQRIAIARALIKNPKVLLLDEATSALDNQSEAIVQQALDKVRKGRTTIIVAHRLTTIRTADLIIAMDDGKVVETGTHEELMKKGGLYRMLVNAQLQPQYDANKDTKIEAQPKRLRKTSTNQSVKSRRSSTLSKADSVTFVTKEEGDEKLPIVSMTELLKLNASEWHYMLLGVLGAVGQGCLLPGYAILFGNVLGSLAVAQVDEARRQANLYSLLFFVIGIGAAISVFLQFYMFAISGEMLTMRLRRLTFFTMLRQEMGWFDDEKNSVGALCSRLSADAAAVQGATGSRIGTIVQAVTTIIFCVGLAMIYSPKLAAVTLPFMPFVLVSVYLQSKIIMGQSVTESQVLEDTSKVAIEAIGNIRTVASLHKEQYFATKYSEALYQPHIEAKKKSHVRGLAFGFAQSVVFFAYAGVMAYGGHLVETGQLDYESVFKVSQALIFGTTMVGQAVAFAPNYSKAKISASRLFSLFNRRPEIDTSAGVGLRMTGEVNSILLRDVEFAYPTRPASKVLRGMNVSVKKGQSVALVGSSGCGKSTIINLLERFYNPDDGIISLNDQDILALNVGYVRSLFGLVSQEPVLFDRTIAENIAYGDNTRTFSQSDIEEVAKNANIHEFVKQLPNGYETMVGAKGTQLSGGQKQRIAIARALIRNPEVLLLDEATSALDAESEKIVQATLEKVQKERTSIIIAHRLSTIRGVDKIMVVQAGIVVEEGTHDELMQKRGHYHDLYQTNV